MEEENSSWVRRVNFSHTTVFHRWDSFRLSSLPLDLHAPLKSKPSSSSVGSVATSRRGQTESVSHNSESSFDRNLRNSTITQRSISPNPPTVLSEAFKEARSDKKRFSTRCPRIKESDKRVLGRLFSQSIHDDKSLDSGTSKTNSPMSAISSINIPEKLNTPKESSSSWAKYFDHGVGRVMAVETTKKWSVDLSKLFLGLKFASGAHSKLYHGIYNDQPVAVKMIRPPDDDENGTMAARLEKQFNREVTILSHLHHRNVLRFVAACRKPPVFCVITEYLSGGSLRAFLHKLEPNILSLQKLITIALGIARGMEYIHSQGIIHRDLKPENILFDQDFCLKIADFGIACEEAYCDSLHDDPGTYRWMAPEMIKHKTYGRKVDVYSFGLLLWEMVAGALPYEDMTPIQAAFAVVNKNLRPVIPADCPAPLQALIEQCWALLPEKRPEFRQIVKILEQFESSLQHGGTLSLVQNSCHDHKKGLTDWIQKVIYSHPDMSARKLLHTPFRSQLL